MAFAGAVSASVHHDDAIAGADQELGLTDDADAVVGDAVKEEDPVAVGMVGADDPSVKQDAVGGADVEVFAVAAAVGEAGVGFADEVEGEFSADRMEKSGSDEPACDACQDGRQEEQDQQDTNEATA